MLKIRLKRCGRKKLAFYRIVVIDSKSKRDGIPVDDLGFYNPHKAIIQINKSNFLKWINKGARPTQIVISLVRRFLI